MSEILRRIWHDGDLGGAGLPRRDRKPCKYDAYVPDQLVGRKILLDGDVAADVAEAEAAIVRLNREARARVDTEALARILLRAEAVASSRIEGLETGARRILHAEVVRSLREPSKDVTATEILANIDAMVFGVENVAHDQAITEDLILEIHRRVLIGTRREQHGGRFREEQNWIGGSEFNPCSAEFVPPPHEYVESLMEDLCEFSNADGLPAVVQAALAHAQFETIHPFADGNGRTGRALIHLILRRRGLAVRVLPPVSLVLATMSASYIDGLMQYRYVGSPTSSRAAEGLNIWVGRFAAACKRSVEEANDFERRIAGLEEDWRQQLGTVRANSATDLLLRRLGGAPVLTVESTSILIGRTFKPAAEAIHRFVDAGILRQINVGRRNRAFEAPAVIAAFTALERRLASPIGDTHKSPPVRRVPRRR